MEELKQTEREYHLKCQVQVKKIKFVDHKNVQCETTVVTLVPRESTEQVLFFNAWLPLDETENPELGIVIKSPPLGPCRVSLMLKNKNIPDFHYMMLMTEPLEAPLKKYDGQVVDIDVVPESKTELVLDGLSA